MSVSEESRSRLGAEGTHGRGVLERCMWVPLGESAHRHERVAAEADVGSPQTVGCCWYVSPLMDAGSSLGALVAGREVALRPVNDSDLDALFEQMRDPESVRMAAFTAKDPDDRTAFDAHMAKVRTSPDATNRVITLGGRLVGSIASFVVDGDTEVTYWIERSFWGQGIAGRALALHLESVRVRPVFAPRRE